VAASQAVAMIGLPEAQINLAHAVIALSVAPKSNAVVTAIGAAVSDVRAGKIGPVPPALRDAHYTGAASLGHGHDYRYAHDDPRGVAPQQHAPDAVADREYYTPSQHGDEAAIADRLAKIRAILHER
jgi:putative ATPase